MCTIGRVKCCVPLVGLILLVGLTAFASGQVPPPRFKLIYERSTAQPVLVVFTAKEIASAVLVETNRMRALHGGAPLKPLAKLDAAADDQAAYLALSMHTSHDSPILGQRFPRERVQRHGLHPELVAENIISMGFTGPRPPPVSLAALAAELVDQWMDSPVHRDNLLNPEFTHLGCATRRATLPGGTERFYSVQVFAAF